MPAHKMHRNRLASMWEWEYEMAATIRAISENLTAVCMSAGQSIIDRWHGDAQSFKQIFNMRKRFSCCLLFAQAKKRISSLHSYESLLSEKQTKNRFFCDFAYGQRLHDFMQTSNVVQFIYFLQQLLLQEGWGDASECERLCASVVYWSACECVGMSAAIDKWASAFSWYVIRISTYFMLGGIGNYLNASHIRFTQYLCCIQKYYYLCGYVLSSGP